MDCEKLYYPVFDLPCRCPFLWCLVVVLFLKLFVAVVYLFPSYSRTVAAASVFFQSPASFLSKPLLLSSLEKQDIEYEIITVQFEFQKGSNKMLRLIR